MLGAPYIFSWSASRFHVPDNPGGNHSKAGYESFGSWRPVPWESLEKDKLLRQKIKWEGNVPLSPIRKLNTEERRKRRPPGTPADVPDRQTPLLNKEWQKEEQVKYGRSRKGD
jgi:hypothetical protein